MKRFSDLYSLGWCAEQLQALRNLITLWWSCMMNLCSGFLVKEFIILSRRDHGFKWLRWLTKQAGMGIESSSHHEHGPGTTSTWSVLNCLWWLLIPQIHRARFKGPLGRHSVCSWSFGRLEGYKLRVVRWASGIPGVTVAKTACNRGEKSKLIVAILVTD